MPLTKSIVPGKRNLFIYTHSYPYICCLVLCDRNCIINSQEDTQSEGAVELLSGREKTDFSELNSRTPNITMKVIMFTKDYSEGKSISTRETGDNRRIINHNRLHQWKQKPEVS